MAKKIGKKEIREKKFATEMMRTNDAAKSYKHISPHVTDGTAGVMGWRMMQRRGVQKELASQMDNMGITSTFILNKLKNLMEDEDARVVKMGLDMVFKILGAYNHATVLKVEAKRTIDMGEVRKYEVEPVEVLEFIVEHDRNPTDKERQKLLN